jgi:predicted aspartyl protease
METSTLGRVVVDATIENLEDLWAAKRGICKPEDIRRVDVHEALVDTGSTLLALPSSMIQRLGLEKKRSRPATCSIGKTETSIYGPVRLTIMGRECPVEVAEVPDDVPVLIGQIPLEYLDFVVDPKNQRLIGNPAHGGEQVLELY